MARHILTEIKKMCFHLQELDYEAYTEQNLHSSGTTEGQKFLDKEGVMLMVLLKKQPVQHYVPRAGALNEKFLSVSDDSQMLDQEQGSSSDEAVHPSYDQEGPSVILLDIYKDLWSCSENTEEDVREEVEAGEEKEQEEEASVVTLFPCHHR
ncbi:uncharacterized protein [Apostichopus japonicus]|uniref:uncharacterized protein isoform X4 n=1 Tax=Stichopus japonicus TaxID=307972 RepID=UPI003AB89578